jgi:hypothetical protein
LEKRQLLVPFEQRTVAPRITPVLLSEGELRRAKQGRPTKRQGRPLGGLM